MVVLRKLSAKNVKVARPTLFNYIYTRGEYEKYAGELWRLMIHEKFDVRVHKTYLLKDVAQAQQVSDSFIFACCQGMHANGSGTRTLRAVKQWANCS